MRPILPWARGWCAARWARRRFRCPFQFRNTRPPRSPDRPGWRGRYRSWRRESAPSPFLCAGKRKQAALRARRCLRCARCPATGRPALRHRRPTPDTPPLRHPPSKRFLRRYRKRGQCRLPRARPCPASPRRPATPWRPPKWPAPRQPPQTRANRAIHVRAACARLRASRPAATRRILPRARALRRPDLPAPP